MRAYQFFASKSMQSGYPKNNFQGWLLSSFESIFHRDSLLDFFLLRSESQSEASKVYESFTSFEIQNLFQQIPDFPKTPETARFIHWFRLSKSFFSVTTCLIFCQNLNWKNYTSESGLDCEILELVFHIKTLKFQNF